MGTTRRTWIHRTFYEYKTYSGLKALEVILKNLGFVWGQNVQKLPITGLQPKRVCTSLGSSCPTCVHQSPWERTIRWYSSQLWCRHWGQEEPKLVYTLFCCKLVQCLLFLPHKYIEVSGICYILVLLGYLHHQDFREHSHGLELADVFINHHNCILHCKADLYHHVSH